MTLAITLTIILAAIVVTAIVGRRRGDDNFARQHRGHHRVKAHTVPARVSDRARTGAIAHLAGRTAG